MRSSGVGAAGGVGELLADFIIKGRTSFDMYNLDVQRFLPLHNNRKFLRDRVKEVPGRLMSIPFPFLEYRTGRALRTSPIFTKLRDSGARFNQVRVCAVLRTVHLLDFCPTLELTSVAL